MIRELCINNLNQFQPNKNTNIYIYNLKDLDKVQGQGTFEDFKHRVYTRISYGHHKLNRQWPTLVPNDSTTVMGISVTDFFYSLCVGTNPWNDKISL